MAWLFGKASTREQCGVQRSFPGQRQFMRWLKKKHGGGKGPGKRTCSDCGRNGNGSPSGRIVVLCCCPVAAILFMNTPRYSLVLLCSMYWGTHVKAFHKRTKHNNYTKWPKDLLERGPRDLWVTQGVLDRKEKRKTQNVQIPRKNTSSYHQNSGFPCSSTLWPVFGVDVEGK